MSMALPKLHFYRSVASGAILRLEVRAYWLNAFKLAIN